jgi:ATP-dependent 26S proteasome regulatory subunit
MAAKQDTDTKSTASLSHFSSLNEQSLKDAIAAETVKLRDESTVREAAMDTRIKSIEDSLSKLTSSIVSQIFKHMSGSDTPFVTKTQLDEKLDRQFAMIEQLSQQIEKISNAVALPATGIINSPPRKQARSHSPDIPLGSPDHAMTDPARNIE